MQNKKKFIKILCLILIVSFGLIPSVPTISAAGQSVKVGTDSINIRKGPGLSYPIVAKAKRGEQYSLLAEKGDWIEIQLPSGEKGWVANWLVSKGSGQQTPTTPAVNNSNKKAIVTADGLRVRKGPDTSNQVIGTIQKGSSYNVISTSGNWIQLNTPYGNGWVSKGFINLQDSSTNNEQTASLSGRITVNILNVRSAPSINSTIIGKLGEGDSVKIISQQGDWTEISYSGTNAWISSEFVQIGNDSSTNSSNDKKQDPVSSSAIGKIGTVTATSLTVRKTGSLDGKPISTVSKGQSFNIIEEVNNWAKIEYKKGAYGWIASWYLDKAGKNDSPSTGEKVKNSTVTIMHDGSNIRKNASTQSEVVQRANQGDTFTIKSIQKDWYELKLSDGSSGFIAGWIVSVNGSAPQIEKLGSDKYLQNKKIIIDPGHGGRDNGTTGTSGTIEKTLTLKTAQLLYSKLKAAGANVVLTRNNDTYIPLASRVYSAHYNNADAFISIHYDSADDRSVRGMTTYYYYSYQKKLAANIHESVVPIANIKDRNYRYGDYYVLRENKRSAILMELGYLSNPAEEMLVTSSQFQEAVASGITQGLAKYYKN